MTNIPINDILPNPDNPRKSFDLIEMEGLAQSIRENGILQPILVEKMDDEKYILQDGERRWRAAKIVGLTEIPAMITQSANRSGNKERLFRAIVANIQRSDLNPVDEARTYHKLLDVDNMSVRQLSIKTGIHEARIFNALSILKLDEPIQKLVEQGIFTHLPNYTKMIMDIPEKSARIELCQRLAARGLGKNGKAIKNSTRLLIKKINGGQFIKNDEVPAIDLANSKKKIDLPKWDILYQAGKVPSWSVVYKSALETCQSCPRRPVASEITCKNCQAAAMLSRLIEAGNREKARHMAEKVIRRRARVNGNN